MREIFHKHARGVLFFSAGKDSLATLLLLKDYWHQLDVVWANPGAPYPEVLVYMQGIQAMVPNFTELTGNQPGWIQKHGWPVDVVPARYSTPGENGAGPAPIKLQPFFACCQQNMWGPLQRYITDSKHALVITGQRREEALRNRLRDEPSQIIDGIEYAQPINEWTAAEVLAYIDQQGHDLPPFYAEGAESSADCWSCTAYLDHNQNRLHRMKAHDPARWTIIGPVLAGTRAAIESEMASLLAITQGMQS